MPARRPSTPRDASTILLEYIAGLLSLPADAGDAERVALAARVDLSIETTGRVLGKSPAAAQKALERARAANRSNSK